MANSQAPAGVPIKVRISSVISSRAVAAGDRIEARLIEDVALDDKTKVEAGATAVLRVIDAQPGIVSGSPASILLKVTALRRSLADSVEVRTAGLQQEVPEIAAGSVLTFRLAFSGRR